MHIAGYQKLTLLDYPEQTACIIFTTGCNMRCPFCHNSKIASSNDNYVDEEEIFNFLRSRVGLLDGVCISGGEPTLQADLKYFIKRIKDLDYLVKLDTNGSNVHVLKDLVESKLVDYVAMDVKNSIGKYSMTSGLSNNQIVNNILESIKYLMQDKVDYEFRTTILKDYHTAADMDRLSVMLSGCKKYYLQKFIKSENIYDDRCEELSNDELLNYLKIVRKNIPNAEMRGVELKYEIEDGEEN